MTTMTGYLTPVPVRRLLRVHLRIWRVQRGVVVGTGLALTVGLAGVLLGIALTHGPVSAAGIGQRFVGGTSGYQTLWLMIGAVAAAAPYRSRWAALVLVSAPRRLRWLAAALASMLLWAVGATLLLAGVSLLAAAATLALHRQSPVAALGIVLHLAPVTAATVLTVTVGFLLGAAFRGVAAPLVIGYALAPAIPLLSVRSVHLGRWLDLGGATGSLAAGRAGLSTVTALCLWVIAPALVAIWRLRRSPVA
jgi:hypothetical protein